MGSVSSKLKKEDEGSKPKDGSETASHEGSKPKDGSGTASQTKQLPSDDKTYLKEPWRKFEKGNKFNEKYETQLLMDIEEHPIQHKKIGHVNIFLAGPIKAGKTSFVNTVASIDRGRISQVGVVGGAGISQTKSFKQFRAKQNLKNFKLFDTMGVQEGDLRGLNIDDVIQVVKGHVPPNYKFIQDSPIDRNTDNFKENPAVQDRMHCVVIVVDADALCNENIPDDVQSKIRSIQRKLDKEEIPRIVLLTKIDELCGAVEADITKTYESVKVKDAINAAKALFRIQEQNIFPVQNYENEQELDFRKDILVLLALRQMLRFATDFLDELYEEEEGRESKTTAI